MLNKFKAVALLAAFVLVVNAQSSSAGDRSTALDPTSTSFDSASTSTSDAALPTASSDAGSNSCVIPCLQSASTTNNCPLTDATCVCGSEQFKFDVDTCIKATCPPEDVDAIEAALQAKCAGLNPCILGCAEPAVAAAGCTLSDQTCICSSTQLQNDLRQCLSAKCTQTDVQTVDQLLKACDALVTSSTDSSSSDATTSTLSDSFTDTPTDTTIPLEPTESTPPATAEPTPTPEPTTSS